MSDAEDWLSKTIRMVSVGMFEQVGEEHLAEYFSRTRKLLGRGGAFLNSGISLSGSGMYSLTAN
jgi:cyclopropane-fatty-acyl-phospholipid synthase